MFVLPLSVAPRLILITVAWRKNHFTQYSTTLSLLQNRVKGPLGPTGIFSEKKIHPNSGNW